LRALIIGGGERGLALAARLRARGDAARVISRDPQRRAAIESVGAEYMAGDPDRIGTLRYACENVTILVWALATATGDDAEKVSALHGSRLHMMLERTIDTTVRGVVYEARGTLDDATLAEGRAVVEKMCRKNEIPFRILEADPADPASWSHAADAAIAELLALDRG
jgi:hypothetical protein